eukprot:CAMPEP_0118955686 /NCGR_PEP_ID=MMETSP1169-20130426/60356_1 /TAXON_ID=36882 /ORGANISM="Pyramimonas obovata, Strain CCMP722" /LENGTH=89 /DNA_ID=CAMNT_0006903577 /DNA_START=331 /DNA_END=597 /DNA_ORIENTATION=-
MKLPQLNLPKVQSSRREDDGLQKRGNPSQRKLSQAGPPPSDRPSVRKPILKGDSLATLPADYSSDEESEAAPQRTDAAQMSRHLKEVRR